MDRSEVERGKSASLKNEIKKGESRVGGGIPPIGLPVPFASEAAASACVKVGSIS